MVCIYCGHETKVTNSRLQKRLNSTWRRRSCLACGNTYTTVEKADLGTGVMVQGPNGLAAFNRDKLFLSIYASLGHRTSAISDASALTATITTQVLLTLENASIEALTIAIITQDVLKRFDPVAGSHYGAYHRQ